ncbi:hypothetical protein Tco_1547883 [Tanacetum coccineum]
MAGSDDTTQPKTTVANEKPYGINNIKTYIPFVLDLNELNNDSWSELFTLHCNSFGVLNIIEGTSSSNKLATEEWGKLDSLSLNAVFHDNKTARAIQLDTELRTIELGSLSITGYCNKISRITDLLDNINSPVDEKNLVTYAINGLPNKITISPTRPPKMSYAPEPGTISNPIQPTPTWTSPPPQYHPTVTPFGSRGVLGPAPGQAHVVQPIVIGSSGPYYYTTGPPLGTWGPQVVYGPYVDQATTLP